MNRNRWLLWCVLADRLFRVVGCIRTEMPRPNERPAFSPVYSQHNLIVGRTSGGKHGNALTQK